MDRNLTFADFQAVAKALNENEVPIDDLRWGPAYSSLPDGLVVIPCEHNWKAPLMFLDQRGYEALIHG